MTLQKPHLHLSPSRGVLGSVAIILHLKTDLIGGKMSPGSGMGQVSSAYSKSYKNVKKVSLTENNTIAKHYIAQINTKISFLTLTGCGCICGGKC